MVPILGKALALGPWALGSHALSSILPIGHGLCITCTLYITIIILLYCSKECFPIQAVFSFSQIHCPPFYVCRTVRKDPVTGHERKEIVITIRGTLSFKVSSLSPSAYKCTFLHKCV